MKCIYQIKNKINNHSYIGSSNNFKSRQKRHLYDLRRGKHHSIYLQRAFVKYNEESFEFLILEETSNLFEREQYWIDLLKPEYNVGSVGGGDNISKHPNLKEIKKKHSINGKSRYQKLTKEERESRKKYGSNNPNWKGGISSNNTCKMCGKKIYPNHKTCVKCCKNGSSNPFYGKRHSDETKEKIRKKKVGKKPVNSKKIIINGISYLSQSDAAKSLGVSPSLISYRLRKGIYTAIEPNTNLGQDV